MRRIAASTLVSSLALASLDVLAEPPKADPARAPIERAGRAFIDAFGRGDITALAAMYAEDAIAFPPESAMLKGRAAIQRFWENSRDMGVKSLEFEVVDVLSSRNLAAETGIATLHVQAAGAATTVKVKYVVVWKKQDGAWKLYRDIWNNLPAATPAAAPAAATPVAPSHSLGSISASRRSSRDNPPRRRARRPDATDHGIAIAPAGHLPERNFSTAAK